MTHTQDFSQSHRNKAVVTGRWRVKEKVNGIWIVRRRVHNIFTAYGLTALASAPGGAYIPPNYLSVDTSYVNYYQATSAGVSTVVLASDPTLPGDTQLVLSAGLASQETVTFTGSSGSGPVTFTLQSPTVNAHATNDPCTRGVTLNDAVSVMAPELQYDPVNAPNTRLNSNAGYSSGIGNYIIQFYLTGNQAQNTMFMTIGLTDNPTIGLGNLHNIFVLGYNHNTINDVEIDGSITLSNV